MRTGVFRSVALLTLLLEERDDARLRNIAACCYYLCLSQSKVLTRLKISRHDAHRNARDNAGAFTDRSLVVCMTVQTRFDGPSHRILAHPMSCHACMHDGQPTGLRICPQRHPARNPVSWPSTITTLLVWPRFRRIPATSWPGGLCEDRQSSRPMAVAAM